jgi:hypothetical protein
MLPKINDTITWGETLAQEQHRKEFLRKANQQRSIRRVLKDRPPAYQLGLARFGGQLVKWGCRLQARYGTLAEASKSIHCVKVLRQQLSTPDAGIGLSPCVGNK